MKIVDYTTAGGKNLIIEYIEDLPKKEKVEAYVIRKEIEVGGMQAIDELNTRQLKGKLWEIKFSQNRIMYVVKDKDVVHFLHACKKQKGKAEKFELDTAIQRAKNLKLMG